MLFKACNTIPAGCRTNQVIFESKLYVCGYTGRGAVVLSFASPRKAQLFLSNAKQAKESALYLCVKDLQKFTFDDKRDKVSNIIT